MSRSAALAICLTVALLIIVIMISRPRPAPELSMDLATHATQECYARTPDAALDPHSPCDRWGRYVATGPHTEPFV